MKDKFKGKTKEQLEAIAQEMWPHENAQWKREMWIKERMIPELSEEDTQKIHYLLHDLTFINAELGTDSSPEERKIIKQMTNKIMKRIEGISPEYYQSIK